MKDIKKKIIRGPACILLDRNQLQDLPDAQMVHFLSYVLKEEGLNVSWAVLFEIAAAFLLEKCAKEFLVEGVRICVEGAYLIVFQKPMPRFSLEHFQEGTYVQQDWHITTNSVGPEVSSMISGWKGAIKGCLIGFGVINGGRICYLDQMEDLQMKKKVLRRLSEKKCRFV